MLQYQNYFSFKNSAKKSKTKIPRNERKNYSEKSRFSFVRTSLFELPLKIMKMHLISNQKEILFI